MENKYLFLAGGAAGVFAAFGIAFLFQSLWAGLFAAMVAAVVYLFLLDRRMIRHLESQGARTTVRVLIILLAGFQLYVSVLHYNRAADQAEILTDIRTYVDDTAAKLETEQALQAALKHYHLEQDPENTLEATFRELLADRLLEDGTFLPSTGDDSGITYRWQAASPDSVIIRAVATVTRGENPEFINANEQVGYYQAAAVLTPGGVNYEREN